MDTIKQPTPYTPVTLVYICHMKNLNLILAASILFIFSSCARKAEEAAEYNDIIIEHQKKIIASFDRFDSTYVDSVASKDMVEFSYVDMQSTIKRSILALDSIGPFKSDPLLQNAARNLFKTYDSLVSAEYKKLLDIKLLDDNAISPAMVDTSFAAQIRIHDTSKEAQDNFLKMQEDFGKKYNLVFE